MYCHCYKNTSRTHLFILNIFYLLKFTKWIRHKVNKEKFEDNKGVTRGRKSKVDRQYTDQKTTDKY